MRHYWDAPAPPPGVPSGATVVARSRCGRKVTLPVWQVTEWSANGAKEPAEGDCETCIRNSTVPA